MEFRGQFIWQLFHFSMELWMSNPGHLVWQQTPLPTEWSHWSLFLAISHFKKSNIDRKSIYTLIYCSRSNMNHFPILSQFQFPSQCVSQFYNQYPLFSNRYPQLYQSLKTFKYLYFSFCHYGWIQYDNLNVHMLHFVKLVCSNKMENSFHEWLE